VLRGWRKGLAFHEPAAFKPGVVAHEQDRSGASCLDSFLWHR